MASSRWKQPVVGHLDRAWLLWAVNPKCRAKKFVHPRQSTGRAVDGKLVKCAVRRARRARVLPQPPQKAGSSLAAARRDARHVLEAFFVLLCAGFALFFVAMADDNQQST